MNRVRCFMMLKCKLDRAQALVADLKVMQMRGQIRKTGLIIRRIGTLHSVGIDGGPCCLAVVRHPITSIDDCKATAGSSAHAAASSTGPKDEEPILSRCDVTRFLDF
jgi:hypothetical protein